MRPLSRPLLATLALTSALWLSACQTPPAPTPASAPVTYSGPTLPIAQSERGVQLFLPSAALFEVGKSSLNPTDSGPYMERLAQILLTKTDHDILLEGHTDNTGSAAMNQSLSEARAQTVREALEARGVAAGRMKTVGYAFNRPVASNATEEGRRLNRRVEVLILDEKVETITHGEPANAFESAWEKLRSLIDQGLVRPADAS